MNLLAFAASHRPVSLNHRLLKVALEHWKDVHSAWDIIQPEFSHFDLPLFNDAVRETEGMPAHADALRKEFLNAHALLIATPEYNWSIPASLKNVVDWMSCYRPVPLHNKPVFLLSATPSERGGMLGLAHVKTTFEGLGAMVYPTMYGLGKASMRLGDNTITDGEHLKRLHAQLDGFAGFASAIQSLQR
jgi:chromate reductase, NAD(P)H dehydrogenase (quinone)